MAQAQQPADRIRRVGVLIGAVENDPVWKPRVSAFVQALAGLGWADRRNMRIDLRWYADDADLTRARAQELVGLQPDIIPAAKQLPPERRDDVAFANRWAPHLRVIPTTGPSHGGDAPFVEGRCPVTTLRLPPAARR
jgi:hypothetical protein